MPVLLARGEPDHVARTKLLGRASPVLRTAAARRHDQRLAERVGVPSGPGARFECDAGADRARRLMCLKQGIDANASGEVVGWSLAGWLRAASLDLHLLELRD